MGWRRWHESAGKLDISQYPLFIRHNTIFQQFTHTVNLQHLACSKLTFMYHHFPQVCAGQLWDVAFAVQAILSCNIAEEYINTLKKAHDFIKASQVLLSRTVVLSLVFL
jgi:hypothetical protein